MFLREQTLSLVTGEKEIHEEYVLLLVVSRILLEIYRRFTLNCCFHNQSRRIEYI